MLDLVSPSIWEKPLYLPPATVNAIGMNIAPTAQLHKILRMIDSAVSKTMIWNRKISLTVILVYVSTFLHMLIDNSNKCVLSLLFPGYSTKKCSQSHGKYHSGPMYHALYEHVHDYISFFQTLTHLFLPPNISHQSDCQKSSPRPTNKSMPRTV